MPSFGQTLRGERERRGITLEEISGATRIRLRYLEALESDDLPSLPGSTFNIGYVRACAEVIGADPEPLVEAYVREEQAQERQGRITKPDVLDGMRESLSMRASGSKVVRRIVLPVLLFATLLGIAGAVYLARRQPSATVTRETEVLPPPREPGPTREPQEEQAALPVAAEKPVEPPPVAPESVGTPPEKSVPPEPALREEAGTAAVPSQGRITIPEFGVGTGIVNRRLEGSGERFSEGTEVWFWTRVAGGRSGESIRHVWLQKGRVMSSIELPLGGSHWRTYSRQTLRRGASGPWAVEARDPEGRLLARKEFVVGDIPLLP